MTMVQLSGRFSLRDIVDNMNAQSHRLYHLASTALTRTTLARINEDEPYQLYQALFNTLITWCLSKPQEHGFQFNNPLYSLDSTTIELCLSLFPWAKLRSAKGTVKLHVGLNHAGYLAEFNCVTERKVHDVTAGRQISFPSGSIVAVDRAYTDCTWLNTLNNKGIYFVSRQKDQCALLRR